MMPRMLDMFRDLRMAARGIAHRPLPAFVTVATLALGLGANVAIFSFADEFLRRPLPVPNGDRLVRLFGKGGGGFEVMSYPDIKDVTASLPGVQAVAAHQSADVGFGEGDAARLVRGELVGGAFFDVMGVRAQIGRGLTPADDTEGSPSRVIVLSHSLWQNSFGGDPAVVGRSVALNGRPFTIVGVAPRGFLGSHPSMEASFWVPLMTYDLVRPRGISIDKRGWSWLNATALLRSGADIETVSRALDTRVSALVNEKRLDREAAFRLVPARALPERLSRGASKALLGFQLISLMVLAVACANIASVVMIRVETRRDEMSIRRALGASRGRIVSQWLAESLLVALLGGVLALAMQAGLRPLMARLAPPDVRGLALQDGLPPLAVLFTLGLAVLSGLAAGLLPALRASRIAALVPTQRGSGGAGKRSAFFGMLIAAQLAVSVTLFAVTGLLVQSLRQASALDLGFNAEGLLLGEANLSRAGIAEKDGLATMERIVARLRQRPEVESATFASVVPLGDGFDSLGFNIPGHTPPPGRSAFSIGVAVVGSDYFSTMQIPIVRGRAPEAAASAAPHAPLMVMIDEAMARRFWPSADPVGQVIELAPRGPSATIMGVARDVRIRAFGEAAAPFVYAVSPNLPLSSSILHARLRPGARADAQLLQHVVSEVAPGVVVDAQIRFEELRAIPLFPQRALAWVTGLFGALTMFLTAVGLFGVVVYAINLRKIDLGVRVALGARPFDIVRSTMAREIPWLVAGVTAGAVGARFGSEAIRSALDGIGPFGGFTLLAVALVVTALAALAVWLPSRLALRIDPAQALRGE